MIELYGSASPNVFKVGLMLEETGLAYRMNWVNVWKGEQFSESYLNLNPNAKIPAIIDTGDGKKDPVEVFESGAILIYLAEKSGKYLPTATSKRYAVLKWLMIQMSGIGPAFGQTVHFRNFAPAEEAYSLSRFLTESRRLVAVYNNQLEKDRYLAGDEYSIADIASYHWMNNFLVADKAAGRYPAVDRWLAEIASRPATIALAPSVVAWRARTMSEKEAATTADLDRLFGRGKFANT